MEYLIERFYRLLDRVNMTGAIHVESRGRAEDQLVKSTFDDCVANGLRYRDSNAFATSAQMRMRFPFPISFGLKAHNCGGLELADLSAWPVARYVIDPIKPNRSFELLKPKLYAGNVETADFREDASGAIECGGGWFADEGAWRRAVDRYGLKVFP